MILERFDTIVFIGDDMLKNSTWLFNSHCALSSCRVATQDPMFSNSYLSGGTDQLSVYAAFNMLLRENVDMGGLKQWEMDEAERDGCRCDNQIIKPECSQHVVTESSEVTAKDGESSHKSPYSCDCM